MARPPATPQPPSRRGRSAPRQPSCRGPAILQGRAQRTPARPPATVPSPRPPPPAPWACSAPEAGSTPTPRPLRPPPAPPRAASARAAVRPTTTPRRVRARAPSVLFAPPWPHLQPDARTSRSPARRAHRRHTDAPLASTMTAPDHTGKRTATAVQGARPERPTVRPARPPATAPTQENAKKRKPRPHLPRSPWRSPGRGSHTSLRPVSASSVYISMSVTSA